MHSRLSNHCSCTVLSSDEELVSQETALQHVSMATDAHLRPDDEFVTQRTIAWISLAVVEQQFTVWLERCLEQRKATVLTSTEKSHCHMAGVGLSHTHKHTVCSRGSFIHSFFTLNYSPYSRLHSVDGRRRRRRGEERWRSQSYIMSKKEKKKVGKSRWGGKERIGPMNLLGRVRVEMHAFVSEASRLPTPTHTYSIQ